MNITKTELLARIEKLEKKLEEQKEILYVKEFYCDDLYARNDIVAYADMTNTVR